MAFKLKRGREGVGRYGRVTLQGAEPPLHHQPQKSGNLGGADLPRLGKETLNGEKIFTSGRQTKGSLENTLTLLGN